MFATKFPQKSQLAGIKRPHPGGLLLLQPCRLTRHQPVALCKFRGVVIRLVVTYLGHVGAQAAADASGPPGAGGSAAERLPQRREEEVQKPECATERDCLCACAARRELRERSGRNRCGEAQLAREVGHWASNENDWRNIGWRGLLRWRRRWSR